MKEIAPIGEGYSESTSSCLKISTTGRRWEHYSKILGFASTESFLDVFPQDAIVLDIGSGEGQFARSIKSPRPDIKVVNINPAFINGYARWSQNTGFFNLAAINPHLPFRDGVFDVVLDCMGSIYYSGPLGGKGRLLTLNKVKEIVRILKPLGFTAFGPFIFKRELSDLNKDLKRLKNIEVKQVESTMERSLHLKKTR